MSDELTSRIATLARLVAEARDLSTIGDFFHEKLVPHPSFLAEGAPAVHRPLTEIVRGAASSYGCNIRGDAAIIHVARFNLWHGPVGNVLGPMAIVIYFDDQHRGVASFGVVSDPKTHHIRFSLPEGARDPNLDLGNLKVVGGGLGGRRGSA